MGLSRHTRGTLLVALGVSWISPEALILHLTLGAPLECLLALRYGIYGTIVAAALCALRVFPTVPARMLMIGGMCVTCLGLGFIAAVRTTSPANVLVILASSSLWASAWSKLFLGESPSPRTIIATLICTAGVAAIVADGLSAPRGGLGELLAITASAFLGGFFTCSRYARIHYAGDLLWAVPIAAAIVVSICGCAAIYKGDEGWPMTDVSAHDLRLVLVLAVVILPIAMSLLTIGPQLIPATECALWMLLETVLGTLWVSMYEQAMPSAVTCGGGLVVLGTLAWHAIAEPPPPDTDGESAEMKPLSGSFAGEPIVGGTF
eukprot:TRINITY_DN18554_c0_g1_i1.p1 TRINITY_DN18554_c0_g1~~TRINITY_DN18554_c0_g1_i1.p1  ORF type:complete len:320 (+),score=73.83 TRINITY_DN18554_c0_g1_i1:52-1011(+)